jgi:hypothetical protein
MGGLQAKGLAAKVGIIGQIDSCFSHRFTPASSDYHIAMLLMVWVMQIGSLSPTTTRKLSH